MHQTGLAGGGYRSAVTVIETSDSQASKATMRFFTQPGLPADPQGFGLQTMP